MHHCFGHAGAGLVSFFQFAFAFGGYAWVSARATVLMSRMCAFNVIM